MEGNVFSLSVHRKGVFPGPVSSGSVWRRVGNGVPTGYVSRGTFLIFPRTQDQGVPFSPGSLRPGITPRAVTQEDCFVFVNIQKYAKIENLQGMLSTKRT